MLGDYKAGDVIDLTFTTRSAGVATALTSGAVSVYKTNSTTESTSGVTLTADFDARTGLNQVHITTASDGTFYAGPADFSVVLTAGTVGGVSVVGAVIDTFSIGRGTADIAAVKTDVEATGAVVSASSVRSAIGLASANLDTQLSTIASYIDMEVATLVTNVSTVLSRLGVPSSDVSTLIAAIKAKTDNLPATPAATGDAMALTVAERASVADKFLGRTLSGSADGGRTVKDALRASRNKVVIDGTTITVYAEDDTTVAWSGTVTRDSALDALSTVDPA